MHARRNLAGALSVLVTGSVLVLSAGAANATASVPDPDDTAFNPVATDLVGVGSDTSQNAVFRVANLYNAQTPAPTNKISSFAATSGGTITLPSGATINRPNGSGAGKALLYGSGNNTEIDFARSSSAENTAEVAAGLQSFPFAVDSLQMAVSGNVVSYAPTSLPIATILNIYKGNITNWNQVPGSVIPAGTATSDTVIKAYIPQSGSGTLSFFTAQLTAANGGTAFTYGAGILTSQEHDPTPIKDDKAAIAPFSVGKANVATAAGNKLRLETGFRADRALYNVVRGADLGNADVSKAFSEAGFFCSDAARSAIEAAGFFQLARSDSNGACGQPTQSAVSNFTINHGLDDPSFVPATNDLIGVGSDTSQHALALVAAAYNSKSPAPANKIASFAATGGGVITLPSGQLSRPNGSGAGKGALYNPSNPDVDFARSSSAQSTAETAAGLKSFPFALDTLGTAVSGNVASNAPANLTIQQILSIYKGDATTWNQVGGTSTATIKPLIPQAGSGTRSFFIAQLTAANGGTAPTLAASVAEVQEHDPAPIQNDPNAIAPFSIGRAGLAGTALHVVPGFKADRALYDVVRTTDVGNADVQAFFGQDGYLCSDNATSLIEQAGFKQLARPDDDGVCGVVTTDPTTDFTINQAAVSTTTTLSATSPAEATVHLVATVAADTGSDVPTGTVTFTEGATTVGSAAVGTDGTATVDLTGVVGGTHSYKATYAPTMDSPFTGSNGVASTPVSGVTVPTTSTLTATSPAAAAVHLALSVSATTGTPSGTVVFKEGTTTVGSATVTSGAAALDLANVAAGSHTYTAVFTPADGSGFQSSTSDPATVTVAAPAVNTATSLTASVSGLTVKLTAKVIAASGTASGTVVFRDGGLAIGSVNLANGSAVLTKSNVKPGKHTYTATYTPSADSNFTGSNDAATATVAKAKSTIKESFPSTIKGKASAKGTVTVTLTGTSTKATGTVTIKKGSKTIATGKLSGGKVTITIANSKLAKGKNSLKISYPGDSVAASSSLSFTITKK